MSGTATDGTPGLTAGIVIILSVIDQRIEHTRLYLDPVS